MIKSFGEMTFAEVDDANIPVSIFIFECEDGTSGFELTANNYMPRKNYISENQYNYKADTREELVVLVNEWVVPLYKQAVQRLIESGELYYWKQKEPVTE